MRGPSTDLFSPMREEMERRDRALPCSPPASRQGPARRRKTANSRSAPRANCALLVADSWLGSTGRSTRTDAWRPFARLRHVSLILREVSTILTTVDLRHSLLRFTHLVPETPSASYAPQPVVDRDQTPDIS